VSESPIERAQRRVERARRELDDALGDLNAALGGQEMTPTRPSVPEAVLAVLATADGVVTTRAIYDALAKRDQLPGGAEPMKALRVTLSRLVNSGRLKRVSDGAYRLPTSRSGKVRTPNRG